MSARYERCVFNKLKELQPDKLVLMTGVYASGLGLNDDGGLLTVTYPASSRAAIQLPTKA